MLETEAVEDERQRTKYGTDRWRREPSNVAASKLMKSVQEYAGFLKSANNSDNVVKDKLRDSEKMLRLLGGDPVSTFLFYFIWSISCPHEGGHHLTRLAFMKSASPPRLRAEFLQGILDLENGARSGKIEAMPERNISPRVPEKAEDREPPGESQGG